MNWYLVTFLLYLLATKAQAETSFFDWLPQGVPAKDNVTLQVTQKFEASGSNWDPALDERSVFHAALSCPEGSWRVGVGKGGQIYSLRGPFGESIPPQRHAKSEWNDEVWQLVAVSHRHQRRAKETGYSYYIHGSGTYRRDPQHDFTFYNPILAERHDPTDRSYAVLTWGQQAHVPTPYRSGALFTIRYRVVDAFTLEVTYGVHNTGPDQLDFINVPWGGVRATTFPVRQVARRDGSFTLQAGGFSTPSEGLPLSETDGWLLFAAGYEPEAPALALVVGREASPWPGATAKWRGGYAGLPERPNPRDYAVTELIVAGPLPPGMSFWGRRFFVMGPRVEVIERARALAESANIQRIDALQGRVPVYRIWRTPDVEPVETIDPYLFASRTPKGAFELLRPYATPGTRWELARFEVPTQP